MYVLLPSDATVPGMARGRAHHPLVRVARRCAAVLAGCSMLVATSPVELVTFDATNTLMRLKRPLGSMYKEFLLGGVTTSTLATGLRPSRAETALYDLDEGKLEGQFRDAFKERCDAFPCFGYSHMSSREWWLPVVRATYEGAGVDSSLLDKTLESVVFPALYDAFATSQAWELDEAAVAVLSHISRWREQRAVDEFKVGVVSNWDDRLGLLLKNLGVAEHFDFILTSRDAGSEKPSADIFRLAQELAGPSTLSQGVRSALHIGDNFNADIVGAAEQDWRAVFVKSDDDLMRLDPSAFEFMSRFDHDRVESLAFVPRVVGVPMSLALETDSDPDMESASNEVDSLFEDPHVDDEDVDGERAWFEGKV